MSQLRGASSPGNDVRDLRLGLVLYGGVSLAVYMHGVSREIHALVRASRLRETGRAPVTPAEQAYARLLDALAGGQDGALLRVIVDVIAGTSAGGINGVYLAKALAHDLPLGGLRDLWLDHGDIGELLRGTEAVPLQARVAAALARLPSRSPLRGDLPSRWHYDALAAMDDAGPAPGGPGTLMPVGHRLDLFVTVTDLFGYDCRVPLASPPSVLERRHRHVLGFAYDGAAVDDFGPRDVDALAFAARATSSFPGAFPAVTLDGFARELDGRPVVLSRLERRFRDYVLAGADPRATAFVDGGVLDNRPFELAIAAIRSRPATSQVDRKLVYVEPDPAGPRPAGNHEVPSPVATVLASAAGIPRHEPILDALVGVARANEDVRRIRDIVETSYEPIARRVEQAAGGDLDGLLENPEADRLSTVGRRLHTAARTESGFAYATYVRTKIAAVVDSVAALVAALCAFPAGSSHELLVRGVVRAWAGQAGLFARRVDPDEAQLAFLRALDVGYRLRRLRFVVAAVNRWYEEDEVGDRPPRAELDHVKARLWERIRDLGQLETGRSPHARSAARAAFPEDAVDRALRRQGLDAHAYLAGNLPALDALLATLADEVASGLATIGERLFVDAFAASVRWAPARRRELLVRYVGFPFWDALLFPVQASSQLGEQDDLDVVRLSPLEATLLEPTEHPKLGGVRVFHFGAFLDRGVRERDYLWGRLDGAERLVRLLLAQAGPSFATDAAVAAWCAQSFGAALDEEADLEHAASLAAEVRRQLAGAG